MLLYHELVFMVHFLINAMIGQTWYSSRQGTTRKEARARPFLPRFATLVLAAFLAGCDIWAEPVRITFLDVGQADAVLVQTPEGKTALVDAGRSSPVEGLRALGVAQIDLFVASHADADHIGGMVDVLGEFPVTSFIDNGVPHTTMTYQRLMEEVEQREEIVYLAPSPRTIVLGSVSVEVLPLPERRSRGQNNSSVSLVVRYGRFAALLTGDSEKTQLNFMAEQGVVPAVQLLKAPHHGSADGVSENFLRAVRPRVVVISVGDNNYGHPSTEALKAFGSVARRVYRTDEHGQVTVLGFPSGGYFVEVSGRTDGASP